MKSLIIDLIASFRLFNCDKTLQAGIINVLGKIRV